MFSITENIRKILKITTYYDENIVNFAVWIKDPYCVILTSTQFYLKIYYLVYTHKPVLCTVLQIPL